MSTPPDTTVSVMRRAGDAPYDDVLPHCDDYASAAHLTRLFLAAAAAHSPAISATAAVAAADGDDGAAASMERNGRGFFIEGGGAVPSGYLDAVVTACCESIVAHTGAAPIYSVAIECATDEQLKAEVVTLCYKVRVAA